MVKGKPRCDFSPVSRFLAALCRSFFNVNLTRDASYNKEERSYSFYPLRNKKLLLKARGIRYTNGRNKLLFGIAPKTRQPRYIGGLTSHYPCRELGVSLESWLQLCGYRWRGWEAQDVLDRGGAPFQFARDNCPTTALLLPSQPDSTPVIPQQPTSNIKSRAENIIFFLPISSDKWATRVLELFPSLVISLISCWEYRFQKF